MLEFKGGVSLPQILVIYKRKYYQKNKTMTTTLLLREISPVGMCLPSVVKQWSVINWFSVNSLILRYKCRAVSLVIDLHVANLLEQPNW